MSIEEQDDIDLSSWELAMKIALRRAKFFKRKQYVWAYDTRGRVAWTVTSEPPGEGYYEAK